MVLQLDAISTLASSLQSILFLLIETPVLVALGLFQKLVCLINIVEVNLPLQAALQSQDELPILISTNLTHPD